VGDGGTILRTTDGGETWATQVSGIGTPLYGVSLLDAKTGIAVGGDSIFPRPGIILRTTDAGITWTVQARSNRLYSVSFIDVHTGIAVGDWAGGAEHQLYGCL
jgi:photosystem II stability/assembly factor-like uncharacterized protein